MKFRPAVFAALALLLAAAPVVAAETLTPVRLATDDDIFLPALGQALGYFRAEGIALVPVKVDSFEKEDYLLQAPLIRGQIDACYHWFQHAVIGARHNRSEEHTSELQSHSD